MSGENESKEERGFTVVDRRGEASETTEASAAPEAPAELPGIDFSTFMMSLSTSAFYHMGMVTDPETGEPPETNLPLARQTIDVLDMLSEKTRGNLDTDEAHLLESLLYELRMRFVEAST